MLKVKQLENCEVNYVSLDDPVFVMVARTVYLTIFLLTECF